MNLGLAKEMHLVAGVLGADREGQGELDHLVPLELGGSNDLSNLWVEAGHIPNPKDSVENRLHREVCSGKISLHAAQVDIAHNWMTAP